MILLIMVSGCDYLKGPKGEPGESPPYYTKTGILLTEDKVAGQEYWDIPYTVVENTSLITVHVRISELYMWVQPNWYYYNGVVRIFDDTITSPGYEYIIVLINDPSS